MTRRSPARAPAPIPTTYSPSPLLSISTITYIASWRGQLLICTIVLFLGAIYFVIRRPIQDHLRRRKEEIARARQRELMRSESDAEERKEKVKETIGDAVVVGEKTKEQRERGREKKKELKKRKGLLRVPTGLGSGTDTTASASASPSLAGPSSLESSPVPKSAELRKRSISHQSPSPSTSPLLSPIPSTPDRQPQIRIRDTEPASSGSGVDVDETPKSSKRAPRQSPTITESADRSMRHALSAEQIPLPPSPSPGPSRLAVPSSEGYMSDTTSNASYSEYQSQSPSKPSTKMKSEGFSTIPEDGWLPPSLTAPASSTKKKKRKGRQSEVTDISISSPLPSDTRPATSSGNPDTGSSIHGPSPARRHSRQDSLTLSRPINATSKEYEVYIDRMEGTIDRLRGELGASVSTTRMAKEAEEEAKQGQERAKAEVMKYKQKLQTVDAHKRREADLMQQLSLERQNSSVLIRRVAELEKIMQAKGNRAASGNGNGHGTGPPPSPFLAGPGLNGPPSPFPNGHFPLNGHGHGHPNGNGNGNGNGNMSPMPPVSPYNMSFPSPSPGLGPRGSVQMPMPMPMPNGMYASPMLHPHSHSQFGLGHGLPSPIPYPHPFRRTSTSDTSMMAQDPFAGPLTPGIAGNGNGVPLSSPYPSDLGHGFSMPVNMPIGVTDQSVLDSPGAQERRTSIEASVLRKKIPELGAEVSIEEEEESTGEGVEGVGEREIVEGLGMGAMPMRHQQGEGWRSSLSPPDTDTDAGEDSQPGSGNQYSLSNPPTPSPQSRLLTPSQLHQDPHLEDIPSSRISEASGSISGSAGGGKVLWGAELTPGQLKQRYHLQALRQQQKEVEEAKVQAQTAGDQGSEETGG